MEPLYGRRRTGARDGLTDAVTEPKRRRLFRLPFRDDAAREEADDEIQFHLDMKTEKLRGMGFSDVEARAEAHRRFGDAERVRETTSRNC